MPGFRAHSGRFVSSGWRVYRLTGSAMLLGAVAFLSQIPQLVVAPLTAEFWLAVVILFLLGFGLISGVLADHLGPGETLLWLGVVLIGAALFFRIRLELFRMHLRPIYARLGIKRPPMEEYS